MAVAAGERGEDIEHDLAVAAVEVPGRLVGQHDGRVVGDGAGDRRALALAAGKLVRALHNVIAEIELVEDGRRPVAHLGGAEPAEPAHRDQHIVEQGELGQ